MSADWEVAPKDATHYFDGDRLYAAHWLKTGFYCVTGFENDGWREDHHPLPLSRCEDRPKQSQAWSGPEDGLPPINTSCQMQDDVGHWVNVLIIANHEGFAHGWHSDSQDCFYSNCVNEFRSIGAIARDKRESAIRELMDIAQVDCRVTAARLVDAGFKREVV